MFSSIFYYFSFFLPFLPPPKQHTHTLAAVLSSPYGTHQSTHHVLSTLRWNKRLIFSSDPDPCLSTTGLFHQCSVHCIPFTILYAKVQRGKKQDTSSLRWIKPMHYLYYSPPLWYSFSTLTDKSTLNNWCGLVQELDFHTASLWPYKVFLKFLQCLFEYLKCSNGALFWNFPTWLSACCFILGTILLVVLICINLLR